MADPTPAPTPDPAPAPNPAPAPEPDDSGKGGKDALLADLAKERDKRQQLEQQLNDFQSSQQSQMDALAKALGLKQDEPADPAKLTAQIADEQVKARTAQVQLAVYRAAGALEANPDALLDSASFLASTKDIDPTDQAAVEKAIRDAVATNPALKAAPPTPSFFGGPRRTDTRPEVGPGLPRLRDAYAQTSK